ncbi:hypothetical protein WN51_03348 [Melipona quadrifasciata]|uniref:Uncharacterized protein n=1 Tax=Melipona quadrifasciata TaxID=166423 RepID=A0A0M8ZWD6_9HYME|nr:hypothetical protein WN51_03348 [Melipona quadrifasciata]
MKKVSQSDVDSSSNGNTRNEACLQKLESSNSQSKLRVFGLPISGLPLVTSNCIRAIVNKDGKGIAQ